MGIFKKWNETPPEVQRAANRRVRRTRVEADPQGRTRTRDTNRNFRNGWGRRTQ